MRPTACALALGLALCVAAPASATTLPSGFGEVDMTTGALG